MFKLTEAEAIRYIEVGVFPDRKTGNAVEFICDLQDAFGHLPYKFVYSMLYNPYLSDDIFFTNRAETLFRILWGDHETDMMINRVQVYKDKKEELASVRDDLTVLIKREISLMNDIRAFEYHPEVQ